MLTMILCLHVACAGTIFRLNTPAGNIQIQSFTTCDIGNASLQPGEVKCRLMALQQT